jgi:alkaline phosphatase D
MRYLKQLSLAVCLLVSASTTMAQIVSGPMLGQVEISTAKIWVQVKEGTNVDCWYWPKGQKLSYKKAYVDKNNFQEFNTITYTATNLLESTTYDYLIGTGSPEKQARISGTFTTKPNWAYRKVLPDVNFLTGSCTYINEPPVDRIYTDMIKLEKPAIPYGGDTSIFNTMATTPADFMLWLGDNWYTREVDYTSEWGLNNRPSKERASKFYQPFLKAMSHYAIWDDHDFGPNDCDASYILSNESRNAFKRFWANPSYGNGQKGIYTKLNYADADFFLLDDRTWRSNDNMVDSIDGQPNMNKRMYGYEQMEWLKNQLLGSNANFKFIVTGSQVLNPFSPFDCFKNFPAEYLEFMEFLKVEKIKGIIFITGDRHHTEVIKKERPGLYPLYDITVSPLTSGTHKFSGPEKNNAARIIGIDEKQNFAKVSITGPLTDRVLTFKFMGVNGDNLGEWSIKAKELR